MLAGLSRAHQEARGRIGAAITQELRKATDHSQRLAVAEMFGLSETECKAYYPEELRALYDGYVHRAKLRSTPIVLAEVLLHLTTGHLKPGDQIPPRTKFTQVYRCAKKTHGEVVSRLLAMQLIYRPGVDAGPLFVCDPPRKRKE